MRVFSLFAFLSFFYQCAVLHQYNLGDIQSGKGSLKKFTIMRSEIGIEVARTTKQAGFLLYKTKVINHRDLERIQFIGTIIALSNMGPRTGNPVYDEKYLDTLAEKIYEKCPSGKVTGLASIRETAYYPVISGEIGKVTGYCYGDIADDPKQPIILDPPLGGKGE